MRTRLLISLSVLALLNCQIESSPAPRTAVSRAAIAFGTADTAHTAVVSILAPGGSQMFDECSGTIVQVKNGQAYVLTAAHCCNMVTPNVVVMANDYANYEGYVFGGAPLPPAYAVTSGSVYWDSRYNGSSYDFCMLKFPAPASCPTIALPAATGDGVTNNMQLEHVGFGMTDTNQNNSQRRHVTSALDQGITSTTLTSTQGGSMHVGGTCEGDSGGPALIPAGAAQASQTVVGVTSFGTSADCTVLGAGTEMRVTSELGTMGFITKFLADAPIGTLSGSPPDPCTSCAQASQTGTCKTQLQACSNDPACLTFNDCYNGCQDQQCATNCQNAAGGVAISELIAYQNCICEAACPTQCASSCTSGGTGGGMQDACTTCAVSAQTGTCKTQNVACDIDAKCIALGSCLGACTTAQCQTTCQSTAGTTAVTELTNVDSCICDTACPTQCATACGTGAGGGSGSGGGAGTGGGHATGGGSATGGGGGTGATGGGTAGGTGGGSAGGTGGSTGTGAGTGGPITLSLAVEKGPVAQTCSSAGDASGLYAMGLGVALLLRRRRFTA